MKNSILLIISLSFLNSATAQDSLVETGSHQIIVGIGFNTTNLFTTPNLVYNTPGLFREKKISLSFNYEGFRPVYFIASEVNRLNISARYELQKGKFTTLPEVGFTSYLDLYEVNSSASSGVSFMPTIGNLSYVQFEKLRLYVDQTITFYRDGLWLELFPMVGYKVLSFLEPQIGMNVISALTYGGIAKIGLYPYFKLSWSLKAKSSL